MLTQYYLIQYYMSRYKWHKQKRRNVLSTLRLSLLRRQDSNMRPPGYEPGELPTAPLRDINHAFRLAIEAFLNCECKGMTF